MKRRAFLGSVVAGAVLAGCLGSSADAIRLASIDLRNSGEETHTVDIEVTFDGDPIVEETYEIPPGETGPRIDSALPDEAGEYAITVDPEGIDSETFSPGGQTSADCGSLEIEILGGERIVQAFEENC